MLHSVTTSDDYELEVLLLISQAWGPHRHILKSVLPPWEVFKHYKAHFIPIYMIHI